jgi:hypothetical protein
MSSVAAHLTAFALSAGDDRRSLLLSIAECGQPLTLGDFGGSPSLSPVFVVDMDGEVHAVSYAEGVVVAARSCGMEVFDPVPVQNDAGAIDHYEVWADSGGTPVNLATGETEDLARSNSVRTLQEIVGPLVIPLVEWAAGQRHNGFEPTKVKRRGPVWGELQTVHLVGKWVAAGAYTWEEEPQGQPRKVRHAEALRILAEAGAVERVQQKGRHTPRFTFRVVTLSDIRFVAYHDLVRAARHGVFVNTYRPWPNVNANGYVVEREFARYMRSKGWRAPWVDEEPELSIKLHGRTWVRARPLDESLHPLVKAA